MNATTRNRLIAVAALAVAAAGLGVIAFGNLGENLVYYWSPQEMLDQGKNAFGPTIRLGGVVKSGTIEWDANHTSLAFRVAQDDTEDAVSVLVQSRETPPQMFRDGIGVVVEGTYSAAGVFESNRLMVNHSNEYRPPEEGEKRDWKETLSESTSAAVVP